MTNLRKISPVTSGIIVVIIIVCIWLAAYPIASRLPDNILKDPLKSSYDVLNVLFTALAFGGVIITLLFQAHESKNARNESVERSILEMFQILTSADFQNTKSAASRVLIASIRNKKYGEYVASRLFAVEQLPLPRDPEIKELLIEYDPQKQTQDQNLFDNFERNDRFKLDDMMNFFSMLAQRATSRHIVNHVDFAYDWWRPGLMLIAQLQKERKDANTQIQVHCKNRMVNEIIWSLDEIYGYTPIKDDKEVWSYLSSHPLLKDRFPLDKHYPTGTKPI